MSERDEQGEIEQLTWELLHRYEEINLLYDIGKALAGVFDIAAIGRTVVDRAMAVIHAEGGVFLRLDPEPQVAYRAGDFPEPLLEQFASGALLGRALAVPVLIMKPLLIVRIQPDDRAFGLLALAGKRDGSAFTAGDGRLLQALGAQAGTAIHTERLVRELSRSERIRSEFEIARQLQRSLLPAASPNILGVEIAATCQPSGHVGGDYFDFFSLQDGRVAIVIADVSGHGVGSAMVMAGLRSTLHAEVQAGFSPARVLEKANRLLVNDLGESGMFVSVFLAAYDPTTGGLSYCNAGHPPPLLLPSREPVSHRLDVGGMLLGIVPGATYEVGTSRLDRGAILVLYTDGLTEARNSGGELFGEEALASLIRDSRALGSGEVHAAILGCLADHLKGREPEDDVTLIVTSRKS